MNGSVTPTGTGDVNRMKLFIGSCLALISTSVAFAVVGDAMGPLKQEFILTNLQIGYVGGAALWGFAVSQLIFSPLVDTIGFRALLRLSFLGHLIGPTLMIFANGFWMLFAGALVIALANGLVEAFANPLVATLFPEEKTARLNQFHVWFPGGIVIGGLASFGLRQIGVGFIGSWQSSISLVYFPTIIYGIMLITEPFPASENVQSGVSMKQMFKATFTRPLFIVLLFMIMITASLELGPNRWIPTVLQAGGIAGILVLVWINGIMAVLRFYAHKFIDRFSPPGLLVGSTIIAGVGLFLFSFAETTVIAFLTATIFAVGVCFIWPTTLGLANEQIPKSGALGLGLLGAAGMAVVGLLTSPILGDIADQYVPQNLPNQQTVMMLEQTTKTFPKFLDTVDPDRRSDVQNAMNLAEQALGEYRQEGELPGIETANAMRAIIESGVESDLVGRAQNLLGPADNFGGRMSFRWLAPFAVIPFVVYLLLHLRFRRQGGYKPVRIEEE